MPGKGSRGCRDECDQELDSPVDTHKTGLQLSMELLKSIPEPRDSDSGRPLSYVFYNNTQTFLNWLQSTSSQKYQQNQNKTSSLIIQLTEKCEIVNMPPPTHHTARNGRGAVSAKDGI